MRHRIVVNGTWETTPYVSALPRFAKFRDQAILADTDIGEWNALSVNDLAVSNIFRKGIALYRRTAGVGCLEQPAAQCANWGIRL